MDATNLSVPDKRVEVPNTLEERSDVNGSNGEVLRARMAGLPDSPGT